MTFFIFAELIFRIRNEKTKFKYRRVRTRFYRQQRRKGLLIDQKNYVQNKSRSVFNQQSVSM